MNQFFVQPNPTRTDHPMFAERHPFQGRDDNEQFVEEHPFGKYVQELADTCIEIANRGSVAMLKPEQGMRVSALQRAGNWIEPGSRSFSGRSLVVGSF